MAHQASPGPTSALLPVGLLAIGAARRGPFAGQLRISEWQSNFELNELFSDILIDEFC